MPPWVQGVLGRPHSCQLLPGKAQGHQHLQKHGLGRGRGTPDTGFLGPSWPGHMGCTWSTSRELLGDKR